MGRLCFKEIHPQISGVGDGGLSLVDEGFLFIHKAIRTAHLMRFCSRSTKSSGNITRPNYEMRYLKSFSCPIILLLGLPFRVKSLLREKFTLAIADFFI
jgi:hypothetical protein